ncbi:AAA family ATPase [Tumebacillus sp. ITR2]|uniref:AAA family ATPase n=1 Tax=Tumebacillus amylolyticus TaxID=2801339 RepID=A0ABS1JFN2_9BACL|nr:AAA family ATPase [Tumebacillus amylolyticus]MBL0389069.1 AAA family ATPase [Tumebacillus amylolyticus]
MKLEKVRLQNFRSFTDQEFSFVAESGQVKPFTVLVGDNGKGKTTVLEGIVRGLAPIFKAMNTEAGDKIDFIKEDIRNDKRWTSVTVDTIIQNRHFQWKNSKRESIMVQDWPGSPATTQKEVKEYLSETFFTERPIEEVPLLLYYSILRIGIEVPMKSRKVKESGPLQALTHCLDVKSDFRRFFEWFKAEEESELREQRDQGPEYQSRSLTAVRTAIGRMMTNYRNVKIKANPVRMVLVDDQDQELRVEQLSGGYKVVFSMVADIASRLAQANPQLENPLEGQALILIDELDLHLHPKWQKRIARDLRNTFPHCQFIVSTHSESIVQSLSADQVINLEDVDRERSGAFKGWSLSEIQEYEMGVEFAKTEEYENLKVAFEEAVDEEDGERAKELYRKLREMIHPANELLELFQFRLIGIGVDIHDLLE